MVRPGTGAPNTLKVRLATSSSTSVATNWPVTIALSSVTAAVAASATGASLTGVTGRIAVVAISSVPSVATTSKVTEPLKLAAGVKLQAPPSVVLSTPAVGSNDTDLTVTASPSTSVTLASSWAAVMVRGAAASSSIAIRTTGALATASSLTEVTSRVAEVGVSWEPSVATTLKVMEPLKSTAGLK